MSTISAVKPASGQGLDRRAARTREALAGAFRELLFEQGFEGFGVRELTRRANVGRSTFYQHFSGKDALLTHCMGRFFEVIADACATPGPAPELEMVLAHFWERRRRGRAVFTGASRQALGRLLARQIQDRLSAQGRANPEATAALLAAAVIGMIGDWLQGRPALPPARFARALAAGARAMAEAI